MSIKSTAYNLYSNLNTFIENYVKIFLMKNELSIFDYSNLSAYLQDFVKSKGNNSKAFSFRSMSTRLSTISYSQLYQVINGKKKFPLELSHEFSKKILKLNKLETRYFNALIEVDHNLSEGIDEIAIKELEAKLNQLKPLELQHIEFDEMTAKPLTMILYVMISRNDIKNILQINPKVFYNVYSEKMIADCLNYLNENKFIQIKKNGSVVQLSKNLMSKNDVPSAHVRNYHKEVSAYAAATIDQVSVLEREYQSYAINVDKNQIAKAKEMIRGFMHDFAKQFAANPEDANSTYNLNLQFFPLTMEF